MTKNHMRSYKQEQIVSERAKPTVYQQELIDDHSTSNDIEHAVTIICYYHMLLPAQYKCIE
jgi:hypothetical protein